MYVPNFCRLPLVSEGYYSPLSNREQERNFFILDYTRYVLFLSMYSYCCLCIIIVVYVFLFLSIYSYCFLCILIVVYVFLLLSMYSYSSSMYSYCSSMYSYRCLCILIVVYVFLDVATLTEGFPCFFLGCKANARV